jgi:N-acetylglutamate synthase-like GNAT family acetyltransferase
MASLKEMTAIVNPSCYIDDELPMTIDYLADHPEFLQTIAQWQHAEWGDLRPGDTLEARMGRLGNWTNRDQMPLTVVAHENGQVLGSASLVPYDMETRMELTPWLAGVFVGQERRRQGIGAQLVRRIMSEAANFNVSVLYLYTVHSESFYSKLGWRLQEHTTYREQPVAIMTYKPAKPQP